MAGGCVTRDAVRTGTSLNAQTSVKRNAVQFLSQMQRQIAG
jgi:hypothetical protein